MYETPVLRAHRTKNEYVEPQTYVTEPLPRRHHRPHWLTSIGVGMITMFFLLLLFFGVLVPAALSTAHHWDCGEGNVCYFRFTILHSGDEFLSFAADNTINVLYMPGGDSSHTQIYTLNQPGFNGKYISLGHADILGTGRQDIIVNIEGQSLPHTLYNTGSGFKWDSP